MNPELNDEWLTDGEQEARESERRSEVINRARNQTETSLQEVQQPSLEIGNPEVPDGTELQRELPQGSGVSPGTPREGSHIESREESQEQVPDTEEQTEIEEVVSPRRSQRTRRGTTHWTTDFGPARKWKGDDVAAVCQILEDSENIQDEDWEPILALLTELDDQEGARSIKTSQHWDMALAAGKKTQDPDTPSIKEALGGNNSGEFQEAMIKEIEALVARGTWKRCLLYTSPSPRDRQKSRMPSSA